jgi:hypothetical protein
MGGGGGGGKGGAGGGGAVSSKPSKQLMEILRPLIGSAMPALQTYFGQATEAMRTGGTQAKIPLIQQAVSASKSATSKALTDTEASLGNQRNTPFGQEILARTRLSGEQQTRGIPVQIAEQMAGTAPQAGLTATGQAVGGLAKTGSLTAPAGMNPFFSPAGLMSLFSVGKSIGSSIGGSGGGGGKGAGGKGGGDTPYLDMFGSAADAGTFIT